MDTVLIAAESHMHLAHRIAKHLGLPLHEVVTTRFADSEISVDLKAGDTSLASLHVIIVHSTSRPVHDHLVELLLMLHMLKNKGARKITAVIPYFGYARQDKQNGGESVAQCIVRLLRDAGADGIVTVELHNPAVMHNAALPVIDIKLTDVIVDFIKTQGDPLEWTVIAPDKGAFERAEAIAQELNTPVLVYDKERYDVNKTRLKSSDGTCSTLKGIIVDDIIDTGSTVMHVAQQLHEEDSACRLFAFCVHPVLSNNAAQNLQESVFERIWVTDTVSRKHGELPSKFVTIDISKVIAEQVRLLV